MYPLTFEQIRQDLFYALYNISAERINIQTTCRYITFDKDSSDEIEIIPILFDYTLDLSFNIHQYIDRVLEEYQRNLTILKEVNEECVGDALFLSYYKL